MPRQTRLATATVNGQANNLAARLSDGYLRIYGGTQPAAADMDAAPCPLLAELRFNAVAAQPAVDGVLTFNPLTTCPSANASGTATWFRALQSDGMVAVMDGSVGLVGDDPNLVLSAVDIEIGGSVGVSDFVHTVAKSVADL